MARQGRCDRRAGFISSGVPARVARPENARVELVMTPIQYGCREDRKEGVLTFCQRSDRVLQFVLGGAAYATGRRWGTIHVLVILAAVAASAAGLSP